MNRYKRAFNEQIKGECLINGYIPLLFFYKQKSHSSCRIDMIGRESNVPYNQIDIIDLGRKIKITEMKNLEGKDEIEKTIELNKKNDFLIEAFLDEKHIDYTEGHGHTDNKRVIITKSRDIEKYIKKSAKDWRDKLRTGSYGNL